MAQYVHMNPVNEMISIGVAVIESGSQALPSAMAETTAASLA